MSHQHIGRIEYINYDGGWWQGMIALGAYFVRLDVQAEANLRTGDLNSITTCLGKAEGSFNQILKHIAQSLLASDFTSNYLEEINRPTIALAPEKLFPTWVIAWGDELEIRFCCDDSEPLAVNGADSIVVKVDAAGVPSNIHLIQEFLDKRAERFLQRPVPYEMSLFPNSLPDLFIATTAVDGFIRDESQLRDLMVEAIQQLDEATLPAADSARHYLASARRILAAIQDESHR